MMTKNYCKQCMGFTKDRLRCDHCGNEEIAQIEIFNQK